MVPHLLNVAKRLISAFGGGGEATRAHHRTLGKQVKKIMEDEKWVSTNSNRSEEFNAKWELWINYSIANRIL